MSFNPTLGGGPAGLYDAEKDAYGRDLFFDGNLAVDASEDYKTVDGIENYRRALIRRIIVRPGEYRLRPDYGAGLLSYVKKAFTPTVRAEIVQRITEQVARDRRTERVVSVSLDVVKDINNREYFKVSLVVLAFGRRQELRPFQVPREV